VAGPPGLVALRQGRAAVELSSWRKLRVAGADALTWLNDLVSADIADLEAGSGRRSLLLTPTGRIRADFTVARMDEAFLLVQDSEQADPLLTILDPYVLSSDVVLEDRTRAHSLVAVPTPEARPPADAQGWRPSVLGEGFDLLGEPEDAGSLVPGGFELAGLEALEAWRIERGEPRFGVDLLGDSLPQEAGWDHAIAYGKGCFLGQEAVAKVRNLGHPPFVVRSAVADADAGPGDVLVADGSEVGVVTSATRLPDGTMGVIARVRWSARDATLTTPSGATLRRR
jgi:tRNA-modifying protein YgfZ